MKHMRFPGWVLSLAVMAAVAVTPGRVLAAVDAAQADAALHAAAQAITRTAKHAQLWNTTGKLMKKAKAARKAGDFAKAAKLAKEAEVQAELAYQQFFEGWARFTADRLNRTPGLSAAQRAELKRIDALLRRHEGRKAYEQVKRLKAEVLSGQRVYRVRRGDTLGTIAARELGSQADWRVIYEENRARIPNPNVLRPGQKLLIKNVLAD